ncbi:MAG: hypothetical protein KJ915_02295 [Candidatus Omnitrophica bacterium]|nr:hypothetical protein [Candidatus Omnitrophota bacterium]
MIGLFRAISSLFNKFSLLNPLISRRGNLKSKVPALFCAIIFSSLSLFSTLCFGEVLNGQAYFNKVHKQLNQVANVYQMLELPEDI